ncbi:hypothetical protein RHI9324_04643 [Rhizobium sp. CECT 9324]|nr:hypothetical protein RHI9324_04643 [Rhizobium sp. CECT 9324]
MAGTLVSINDGRAHGFGRATDLGSKSLFSRSRREGKFSKFARYIVPGLLGFDIPYASRQRKELAEDHIIWTCDETECVAIVPACRLTWITRKILEQTVCLLDRWAKIIETATLIIPSSVHRCDHFPLTTEYGSHSHLVCRRVFTFGSIRNANQQKDPAWIATTSADEGLTMGNERRRDWQPLVTALRNRSNVTLVILSSTITNSLAPGAQNKDARLAKSDAELTRGTEGDACSGSG